MYSCGVNLRLDKNLFGKLWSGSNKKILLFVLVATVGVALMLMGGDGEKPEVSSEAEHNTSQQLQQYTDQLKRDIRELCEQVGGVSDVTVAVSLECGFEYVYATDENNEMGINGNEASKKYITIGSGSSEAAVYITEKLPRIGGVGIVCRGGSNPDVIRRLTSLISAAYNIGSNKIYVTGT